MRRLTKWRLKLYLIRACGFVAAGVMSLVCAAITAVLAAATIHLAPARQGAAFFLACIMIFTVLATLLFAGTAYSALHWWPPVRLSGADGGDENPPPHALGVPASLGPRGPQPLVGRAKVA